MTEITFRSDMQVDYVQHMGSDEMVARAARVSTGSDLIENDKIKGLIRYLVRERHTSTLEHCTLTVRVEAPIFVAREWMRHRTMSYNEISGRYAKLAPVFYVPDANRPLVNAGSGARPNLVHTEMHGLPQKWMKTYFKESWSLYSDLLNAGVANEVARNVLPVGIYTQFYATANLNNWFKFLHLRDGNEGHPQYEIVEAANKVAGILEELYPVTYGVWAELNGRGGYV